ncbi:MAG: iron-sulfur cluster assembly scaffold protein [Chloroflexi bacterium]|nr:iron-sulfur cluster assembly scaffold protein [Chloroflexota bacterium]
MPLTDRPQEKEVPGEDGTTEGPYSQKVIDRCLRPRNLGEFDRPDGYAKLTRECGDTLQLSLRVRDGTITEARFLTDGCGLVIACGSAVTELVKGRTMAAALEITPDDVMKSLDGLPESEIHCAVLAVRTLRQALKDYSSLSREPWRTAYRHIDRF